MNPDNLTAQIIGVFFAETAKNIAKGSANLAYENFHLFFDSEITSLNLSDSVDAEEATKQLEARPDILEKVQRKLTAHPALAEEISKAISEKLGNSIQITANNIKNAENFSINQSGAQFAQEIKNIIQNPTPELPKASLKAEITFKRTFILGSSGEHYDWQIKLINDGESTVYNFRVDIKFPSIFLNQNAHSMMEVQEKRTEDYRLFRTTSAIHSNKILHAEDEHLVFLGDYSISKEMRENGDLKRLVIISIFADDKLVNKIERKMSEFVNNE